MVAYAQEDLDAMFADMDVLLGRDRPTRDGRSGCVNCGSYRFSYESGGSCCPGELVCDDCAIVQPVCNFYETMYGAIVPTQCSNYKRIHHWHERVSQLLLMESEIPHEQMLEIGKRLLSGQYPVINKDTIRAVLRSLKMQPYIEKYLQVIFRVAEVAPPVPGPQLCQQLDSLFLELQVPFNQAKQEKRKNFLNYNYVFCRLFQKLGCKQFCMFFPLIKSKQKLKALDETWHKMCKILGWEITALESVPPFSVHLEQPDLLLSRLAHRFVAAAPVAPPQDPWKKGFPRWGRYGPSMARLGLKRPRSTPTEREVLESSPKSIRCR